MADNIDNFTGSDFYSIITADTDLPEKDLQKYILATSDFAKSIQTDINHYVTRDRINYASFRQKLDLISKNILRRQNPLELAFEDISTFDTENPIVGSLLGEIDLKKKQTDSDFIKSLPSQPDKEFEIKKHLDKLRGISTSDNNTKNNNNINNNNGPDLFGPGGNIPQLPTLEDFLDNDTSRPPLPPPPSAGNVSSNFPDLFQRNTNLPPTTNFDNFFENAQQPSSFSNATGGIGNDLFGSQAATAKRENKTKTKTQSEVDDFLYKLPENMPDFKLEHGLVQVLGSEAEDLFDPAAPLTKKEEEDEILKDLMEEYGVQDIKKTMDETGQIPESIYFFYGGESETFVNVLKFIGLSPINRGFGAFLLSDLGRQTMTENKLSIHVESGDVFYSNHNTGENFYNFLLSQQNDEAAYVPKKYHIGKILRHVLANVCMIFQLMIKKSLTFLPLKIQNTFFIDFMTLLKQMEIQDIGYCIQEKYLMLLVLKKLKKGISF